MSSWQKNRQIACIGVGVLLIIAGIYIQLQEGTAPNVFLLFLIPGLILTIIGIFLLKYN